MKVLRTSENLTKVVVYNMTEGDTEKMSEAVGADLNIGAWLLAEDEDQRGNIHKVLVIKEDGEDGLYYGTISETFISKFEKALDMIGEIRTIRVMEGTSKQGRKFVTMKLVA
jgi:hypothetical protein